MASTPVAGNEGTWNLRHFGSFVGAATIRAVREGMAQGAPNEAEIESSRRWCAAMEDGAFGVASALIYPPGNYATTTKLGAMAKAMAPYGGVYIHAHAVGGVSVPGSDRRSLEIGRWRRSGGDLIISRRPASATGQGAAGDRQVSKRASSRRGRRSDMYPYNRRSHGFDGHAPSLDQRRMASCSTTSRTPSSPQDPRGNASDKTDWENWANSLGRKACSSLGSRMPRTAYVGKRLSEIAAMRRKTGWMRLWT